MTCYGDVQGDLDLTDSDSLAGPTLQDTSRRPPSPRQARLVYIGSPEDGFAGAGQSWSLAGLERIEFGRARGSELEAQERGSTLRIELPFPWVSGRHADLDVAGSSPFLHDRGSRNGTLVEGRTIERIELGEADVFELGRSFWTVRSHRDEAPRSQSLDPSAGGHPGHLDRLQNLERLAPTRVPVLLAGETGSGKGYLARALHRATGRDGPLVQVDVLAQSMASRLFAGEGASELMERARGGTLVLEEVGELPSEEQAQLLSALLTRLPAQADALGLAPDGVRLVASTTRDLRAMVETGSYRADLYGRLAGYEVAIPPLRHRREDLGLLVRALARDEDDVPVKLHVDVFRSILAHTWPFNVRELGHCLRAALARCGPRATVDLEAWSQASWRAADVPTPMRIASVRHALVRELATHRGDKVEVARSLKCDVADIDRWLERFALVPETYARSAH